MLSNLFNAMKTRRRSPKRIAKSQQPGIETMEGRQLLSTVPYVLFSGQSVVEGTGGSTTVNFKVSLSSPAGEGGVTVNYRTYDGTARAGSDYTPVAVGTVTIPKGHMSAPIPISITTDSDIEQTESFGVQLWGATNAQILQSRANSTITDDDTPVDPTLSVADVQFTRGLNGTRTMYFTVQLNTKLSYPVEVRATTSNGSALARVDYVESSELLKFNVGETTKTFAVTVYGTTETQTEYYYANLTDASIPIARKTATAILYYGA